MIQQLAQNSTDTALVIAVMLMAFGAFVLICWLAMKGDKHHYLTMAHAPLNDDAPMQNSSSVSQKGQR